MTGTTLNLGPIGQIAVHANDLDNAEVFYRDALGLPLIVQFPPRLDRSVAASGGAHGVGAGTRGEPKRRYTAP